MIMSRDMKASCTDYQEHAQDSVVPFASSSHGAILDELREPERSVRPTLSFVVTTCPSDTDEGDYETSSEGMVLSKRSGTGIYGARAKESFCVYFKEKSASLSKRAAIKREVISDPSLELMENRLTQKTTYVCDSLIFMSGKLAQSKSLPILKSEISRNVPTNFAVDTATLSACKRKMSMIMERTIPPVSSYPSISLRTGAMINFCDRRYELSRLTSKISCDTTMINDKRSEEFADEVTLDETKNNRHFMNWNPRRDVISTFFDESASNMMNDDLIDIAKNSYSSIKSTHFPPDFSDFSTSTYFDKSKRTSNDIETLLKIDNEFGPLRYQYNETIRKTRALGLSDMGFNLDICRRQSQTDIFERSALSANMPNYLSSQCPRQAAISSDIVKNRSALVDKISPSSVSFSMVGKPSRDSSWLNENRSSCRQEALSFASHDVTFENLDGPRAFSRAGNSVSYFPTTNSHRFQGENVVNDRSCNLCVSNSNFQPCRKSEAAIERATSTWDGWFAQEMIDAKPSTFNITEYKSHLYLNQTVENSLTSTSNSFEIRRQKSIVRMIDNNWSADSSNNQNSIIVETEFASRDNNYPKSIPFKDNRISSSFALKSIDAGIQTGSAPPCASQIRVVSVNTEFCTAVEKRYINRSVSPIQRLETALPTTPNNDLFAAKMSGTFAQQVRADSSEETAKVESSKIRSIDVDNRDALADAGCKRDFGVQKIDSRLAAEDPTRFPEFKRNEADLMKTEIERARCLRLPRAKKKITIVPIVFSEGTSESLKTADVDFAIPTYASKLNYQIAPFDTKKFREMPSSSNGNNADYRHDSARLMEFADEKRRRVHTNYRDNRYAEENRIPSRILASARGPKEPIRFTANTGIVKNPGEYRESGRQRIAKAIPGMRSTPEDFLCET